MVISNLVILSEKLELNLQELDLQRLIELLAVHPKCSCSVVSDALQPHRL